MNIKLKKIWKKIIPIGTLLIPLSVIGCSISLNSGQTQELETIEVPIYEQIINYTWYDNDTASVYINGDQITNLPDSTSSYQTFYTITFSKSENLVEGENFIISVTANSNYQFIINGESKKTIFYETIVPANPN